MDSSSGNSSGASQLQNSGSEVELQLLMDQRKRKRMESNRESARRSRMKKQQYLDDLMTQLEKLRNEKNQILTRMNITNQHFVNLEAENSVLRAQMAELSQRLQSLNEILSFLNAGNYGELESGNIQTDNDSFMNSWNILHLNQPVMASADMFYH